MQRSEQIAELVTALAKAQGAMKNPPLDSANPHFKSRYSSLAGVRDAVIPALSAHGLSVTQFLTTEADAVICETILWHESGEFVGTTLRLPVLQATQHGYGGAATYAKRYALMALCCVAGDTDDDGNTGSTGTQASVQTKQGRTASNGTATRSTSQGKPNTPDALAPLRAQIEAVVLASGGTMATFWPWAATFCQRATPAELVQDELERLLRRVQARAVKKQEETHADEPSMDHDDALVSAFDLPDDEEEELPEPEELLDTRSLMELREDLHALAQRLTDLMLQEEAIELTAEPAATFAGLRAMLKRVETSLRHDAAIEAEQEDIPF